MEENKATEQTQVGHDIVMPSEPAEDPNTTAERKAFVRYVQDQGEKIPSNFKSAEDWFNSLKQAQSEYTKTRQEIAELKKQYNDTAVSNPNYDPQAQGQPPQPEAVVEDLSKVPEELKITKPVEPTYNAVSTEDWQRWGREIDKTGDLSATTKKEVAKRLNADPVVVEQMIRGRQAMQKQAFDQSAQVVGGADNLKRILKWAGETFSPQEIQAMNQGLQGAAASSILLGLNARFQQANQTQKATQAEPSVSTPQAMTSRPPKPGPEAQAFVSEAEMKAAINDPRYRTDTAFRQAVEKRIIISHQHGYKGR